MFLKKGIEIEEKYNSNLLFLYLQFFSKIKRKQFLLLVLSLCTANFIYILSSSNKVDI